MGHELSDNTHQPIYDADYILCECDLEALKGLVSRLELEHTVSILKTPSICLAMIPAEDSLERQRFYLGEALTTECEVLVGQGVGYGLCLGDEPLRAYCLAVIDALLQNGKTLPPEIDLFLRQQHSLVMRRDRDELDLILQTQVDFKLMEEA